MTAPVYGLVACLITTMRWRSAVRLLPLVDRLLGLLLPVRVPALKFLTSSAPMVVMVASYGRSHYLNPEIQGATLPPYMLQLTQFTPTTMKFATLDLTDMPKKTHRCTKVTRKVIDLLDESGNVIGEMVQYERVMEKI